VLLVPLLLLASPGRAVTHGRGPDSRATRAHASGAGAARAVDTGLERSSPSPSWAVPFVMAADYRTPRATTTMTTTIVTTTTAAPHPAPVVRASAAPATSAPPPTTTTTRAVPTTTTPGHQETGQASWYWAPAGTCASPNLPFGTEVTVTDLANGRSTTCTVDDRMGASTGRVLDLAEASFAQLADPSVGVVEVRLTW
jgi:rare lipoprotein A